MITVAQIGVGYWGPNLLRNLVANKDCVVKIVVDISEERLVYVKRLYPSISTSTNYEDALNDPAIHAVVIATPVATHFELAVMTLKAKKHILVEKPMATTTCEVEKIGIIAQQNNLVVMAGHTFLYNPAVRYLKKLIDLGEIGDAQRIYSQRLNLGRIRSDVDALWNFAPHDISIIQYLLNNPTPIIVARYGVDYLQKGIDDVVFLNLVYLNKIMANIHVSWLDPQRIRRMTVVGSKKMIVYDDVSESKIAIYDKGIDRMAVLGEHMDYDSLDFFKFDHRSGDIILPKIKFDEPLKIEIEHFLDCIENGTECLTGLDHTKKVVDILSRANSEKVTP